MTTKKRKDEHPEQETPVLNADESPVVVNTDHPKKPQSEPDASIDDSDDTNETPLDPQAQELTQIESTEVASDEKIEESADPDKEVVIKKPVVHTPWWKRPKLMVPVGALVLVIILLAIPPTRYFLVGWAWRENVQVTVKDLVTGGAVSDATVLVGDKKAQTNSAGLAVVTGVNVGYQKLRIEKQNYETLEQPVTVEVFSSAQKRDASFKATGRIVQVTITDRLTGKPVTDATISSGNAIHGRTDATGHASVVIPASGEKLVATLAAAKYRTQQVEVTPKQDTFQLVPEGMLYFLSKLSGKIDVVKTNLDGSDRKTVVAGTGSEGDNTTLLLAARDWKYLALQSKREAGKREGLYLLNTTNDGLSVIDNTAGGLTPIGWAGHYFLYTVQRANAQEWEQKAIALKSYNATTGKTITLEENASDPISTSMTALYESLGDYFISEDVLYYTKTWDRYGMTALPKTGKQSVIVSIKPDGSGRKGIKGFDAAAIGQIQAKQYLPQEIYYQINSADYTKKPQYGEVEGGVYKDVQVTEDTFDQTYPTFLISPSGNATFWFEPRDGKNALFVGDKNGGNKQELAAKSEFKPFGWLTDGYLLLQKQNSELYVTTIDQLKAGAQPLKVSDYHRPVNNLLGYYGTGYGGQ